VLKRIELDTKDREENKEKKRECEEYEQWR
jgi:hypothetical protein